MYIFIRSVQVGFGQVVFSSNATRVALKAFAFALAAADGKLYKSIGQTEHLFCPFLAPYALDFFVHLTFYVCVAGVALALFSLQPYLLLGLFVVNSELALDEIAVS